VETQRFVGSTVNVILTRQTCGQRSSRTAESKRRALGSYFPKRICYMFLISKCRRDWDSGLCTTSGLAFGEPQRSGDFRGKKVFLRRKNRILKRNRGASPHTPLVGLALFACLQGCWLGMTVEIASRVSSLLTQPNEHTRCFPHCRFIEKRPMNRLIHVDPTKAQCWELVQQDGKTRSEFPADFSTKETYEKGYISKLSVEN